MSNPITTEFKASVDAIVEELVTECESSRSTGEKTYVSKADVVYVVGTRLSIPEWVAQVFNAETGEWNVTGGGDIYDGLALLGCFSGFVVGRGKTGIQRKTEAAVVAKPAAVKLPSIVKREAAKAQPVQPVTEA